jgi:hypothetical protein
MRAEYCPLLYLRDVLARRFEPVEFPCQPSRFSLDQSTSKGYELTRRKVTFASALLETLKPTCWIKTFTNEPTLGSIPVYRADGLDGTVRGDRFCLTKESVQLRTWAAVMLLSFRIPISGAACFRR